MSTTLIELTQTSLTPSTLPTAENPLTLDGVIALTKLSKKRLSWLSVTSTTHYTELRIPKRNGRVRTVYNPDTNMRYAQYLLKDRILDKFPVPAYVHAFESDRSIPKMASLHVGKKVVVSVDIRNFFPSISQRAVQDMLLNLHFDPEAAHTISEICTYKWFVPQGALTSPKISNLFTANTFGPDVEAYCREHGWTLSIYADDITISTDDESIDPFQAVKDLRAILRKYGLKLAREKTKVMPEKHRQYVCGLVVNTKTNLLRKNRMKMRAVLHNIRKNGVMAELPKFGSSTVGEMFNVIRGRLAWWQSVDPQGCARYAAQFTEIWEAHKEALDASPEPIQAASSVV